MVGKNLKYYRLKNNMSMKELANLVNITPMAINYYEKEERRPDIETIKALAKALNVKVTDFLISRDKELTFSHQEFRKNSKLTAKQQEFIREEVEEYFSRFYQTVNILGGEILPDTIKLYSLELSDSAESNAKAMRKYLGLSLEGPVGNLIEILENKGILVHLFDMDNDAFSGMNGTVNNRPYIIINKNMSAERIRSTIAHEIAHFVFSWPNDMEDKEVEKMATSISGAFLFPHNDVIRELGVRRSVITNDMIETCKEYGISMYMLVKRANICNIFNDNVARKSYIHLNQLGWRKNEPSRIKNEYPRLFNQLVYRAVSENEITIQKGAELLKESYEIVLKNSSVLGE